MSVTGARRVRHNLKIDKKWLDAVVAGRKKAEIRRADRRFSEGDELLLYTHDQEEAELVLVTHALSLSEIPGYEGAPFVSLSIERLRHLEGEAVNLELRKGSFG
jgi:hypothetical protein